jgi:hypothetical protein
VSNAPPDYPLEASRASLHAYSKLLLAATLWHPAAAGADSEDAAASMFSFSGFGTLGVVHSSENQADFSRISFRPTARAIPGSGVPTSIVASVLRSSRRSPRSFQGSCKSSRSRISTVLIGPASSGRISSIISRRISVSVSAVRYCRAFYFPTLGWSAIPTPGCAHPWNCIGSIRLTPTMASTSSITCRSAIWSTGSRAISVTATHNFRTMTAPCARGTPGVSPIPLSAVLLRCSCRSRPHT